MWLSSAEKREISSINYSKAARFDGKYAQEMERERRMKSKQADAKQTEIFLNACLILFQEDCAIYSATQEFIKSCQMQIDGYIRSIPQITMQLTNIVSEETEVAWETWRALLEKAYEKVEYSFKSFLYQDVFMKHR